MLKINDTVKVKPGIKDPDTGRYDMSGWQGRVTEIEETDDGAPVILIVWDSQTLRAMPEAFVEESVRDGFAFGEMYLSTDDVEPAEPRDGSRDRDEVVEALQDAYRWADLGEQGKRIKAVEDACENDFDIMQCWFEHLENNLKIPCKVTYTGYASQSLPHGAEITLNGFVDADDEYGVIGSATYRRTWIQVRLCDVEPVERTRDTEALEDYLVWFAEQ